MKLLTFTFADLISLAFVTQYGRLAFRMCKQYRQLFGFCMLILSPFVAHAESSKFFRLPEFASICIEEKVTGFSWANNQWVERGFKADDKYLVRKLPIDTYKDRAARASNKLLLCKEPTEQEFTEKGKGYSGFISVCYQIKEMGEEANVLDSRMCDEYWSEGKLQKISCSDSNPPMFLHPDGLFIRFPWHSNIERNAKSKDSLVLSVGACSKVN